MKLVGFFLALCLSFLISLSVVASETSAERAGEWLVVERADFPIVCREDGELRPVTVTTIGFLDYGKIGWMIPEGTRVKKGEKLISLETETLEEEIQVMQDAMDESERNLASYVEARELEARRLESDMAAEEDRWNLAKLKEKEILALPTEFQRSEAEIVQRKSSARLSAARTQVKTVEPLVKEGFVHRSDYDDKKLELALAQIEARRAKLKHDELLAGAKPHERKRAVMESKQAEYQFGLKKLDREVALEQATRKVQAAERKVKLNKVRLTSKKHKLLGSTRYAPHAGIVAYRKIGYHKPKKVAVGDSVGPWRNPMDLPSYSVMKVRTQIPESTVRFLRSRRKNMTVEQKQVTKNVSDDPDAQAAPIPPVAGQGSSARVWVKTMPEKVYPAEVIWIDGWARDRNSLLSAADVKSQGLAGVRVFNVEVELLESDPERLREGFQATVEFPVAMLPNVMAIPMHAVRIEKSQAFVRILKDGIKVEQRVQLGAECNGRIVVSDGLNAGDRIWLPSHQEATSESTGNKKSEKEVKGSAPVGSSGKTSSGKGGAGFKSRPSGGGKGGGRGPRPGKRSRGRRHSKGT